MKLRTRIALLFIIGALVPIAAATVAAHHYVTKTYRQDYRETLLATTRQFQADVRRVGEDVTKRISLAASRDHRIIGGFVRDIEKNNGALSYEARRKLLDRGAELGQLFDVLYIFDAEGVVLYSLHNPIEFHDHKPELSTAITKRGAFFTWIDFQNNGKLTEKLCVVAKGIVTSSAGKFIVVGGTAIDHSAFAHIEKPGATTLSLSTRPETSTPTPTDKKGQTRIVPLLDANSAAVAFAQVHVSDVELKRLLGRITILSGSAGLAAVIFIGLLAFVVARRISSDLDTLVAGAQEVSRGNLEHTVPESNTAEIQQVAETFNQMTNDLRESKKQLVVTERVAAWRDVARQLAHEIKNPLTPIKMSVETLRRTWARKHNDFDAIFEESTQTVIEETDRLKRTLDEFSKFARLPRPELEPTNINSIIKQVVNLYSDIVIEMSLDDDFPEVVADKDQMHQIIYNLLANARDAVEEQDSDGRILVETELRGSRPVIVIEDTGPGIPETLHEKVFQPYFTTKSRSGGSGIGLALVHRMLSDHGWRINLSKRKDGKSGARFEIWVARASLD